MNLNTSVPNEPDGGAGSLNGTFFSLPWALDVHPTQDKGYVVIFGGDSLLRVDGLRSGAPVPSVTAGGSIVRIPTGKNPRGVVINPAGTRAYVQNYVGRSVTVVDAVADAALGTLESTTQPAPGSAEATVLLGKELFNTALGPPANSFNGRFTMSDNGWGGCFNCHPDGLDDGVTWIFDHGPRQTIPLDGTFAETSPNDQRVLNWSAVRTLVQDFEKNTENVSGGFGLIGVNGSGDGVVDHGANSGLDPRADAIAEYVKTIRSPRAPPPASISARDAGRAVFDREGCDTCHGGLRWTSSKVRYTLPASSDSSVTFSDSTNRSGQIVSVGGIAVLRDVGSFDPNGSLEVQGGGATLGQTALGGLGFNPPSLLGAFRHAPYFHDGRYTTFEDVIASNHGLNASLTAQDASDLAAFLRTIDSATDNFLILNDLAETFAVTVLASVDPSGHEPFIGLQAVTSLDVEVTALGGGGAVIFISGPSPFVQVSGSIGANGAFSGSGSGTVAGNPNTLVTMSGTFDASGFLILDSTYTMGGNGTLPGGQPVTYTIDGQR